MAVRLSTSPLRHPSTWHKVLGTRMLRFRSTAAIVEDQAPQSDVFQASHDHHDWLRPCDTFERRHIGSDSTEIDQMLAVVGCSSMEEFIAKTVPADIRLTELPSLGDGLTESEVLLQLETLGQKNQVWRSYIGLGYHNTLLPSVIKRCVLQNPGWYTQYTPYQAELAQGRLESLLNYQTMIQDLTGLEISNASLLDEATAGAEAFSMAFSSHSKKRKTFVVDEGIHPQTLAVIRTRADPFDVTIQVADVANTEFNEDVCGVLFQYPDTNGTIRDFEDVVKRAHAVKAVAACSADLLSLTLLKPPGDFGCDIAVGSVQRFGIPLGYGGPHAAYIATTDELKRRLPGRIVGVTIDTQGNKAYRLALQTRETHIRRGKATSNICTAQALLANISAMYGVYHGPHGLKAIATRVHQMTRVFADAVEHEGHEVQSGLFFDTIKVKCANPDVIKERAAAKRINLREFPDGSFGVSLDEAVTSHELVELISVFSASGKTDVGTFAALTAAAPSADFGALARDSTFMTHAVFNKFHSETELMRYCKVLENKDVSLVHSMIPLGSCTMKLNAATEMEAVTMSHFANLHPFAPKEQALGYWEMFAEITEDLCKITGYDAVTLHPNSGAQGELAGMMAIRGYLRGQGQSQRTVCLIPASAHGTNPATAAMCGMKIVPVKNEAKGAIDMVDLKAQCEKHKDQLAAIMVTYPSTYGVFDENIREICDMIHSYGGQVYLDGANMNAQCLLARPGDFGADVSHLNLHKTFCIPHGGGGPGMGPIGVKSHLIPHLPSHPLISGPNQGDTGPISAAPFGSSLITPISWAYIKMMGTEGIRNASAIAVLHANYMAERLAPHFPVTYRGSRGSVAHEFIISFAAFKQHGIQVVDVAKRLQDFGLHSPTMSWPVPDSLMIEPTESECKEELDRYVDALITIRHEIQEVIDGKYPQDNNVVVNSPHPAKMLLSDNWPYPYTREKAAYPTDWVKQNKFWVSVARVDDAYGDLNLVCSCPPMESYLDEEHN